MPFQIIFEPKLYNALMDIEIQDLLLSVANMSHILYAKI